MLFKDNNRARNFWNMLKPWVYVVLIFGALMAFASPIQTILFKLNLLTAPSALPEALPKDNIPFDFSFTVKDLDNRKISFDRFKGKVLFIKVWATWCGPCRAEMPTIQALYERVKNNDIEFVMLSIDEDKDFNRVKKFVEKNGYTFPVFMPSGKLPEQLWVPSIPTTFIVDKAGNVVRKKTGMTNFNTGAYVKLLEDLARQ
jgi:thiol-disulfide isomerase/thioredoxin